MRAILKELIGLARQGQGGLYKALIRMEMLSVVCHPRQGSVDCTEDEFTRVARQRAASFYAEQDALREKRKT